MAALKTIETKLFDIFKGLPPLRDNAKEALAKVWPWIALIFGVLQLLAAWALWQLTRVSQGLIDLANSFYTTKPIGLSGMDKTLIYLGLIVLLVDGVILLMAYPQLKIRNRKGWDLLFLGTLINVAYSVLELFIRDRGISSFIFGLISSAVGFYLLFQVRDKYKTGNSSPRQPKISS